MKPANTAWRRLTTLVRRRKLAVGVTAWAILLAILAFVSQSVTVREQVGAGDALKLLNAGTGDAAGLLTGQPYSYGVDAVTSGDDCKVTMAREGKEFTRTVSIYTPAEDVMTVAKSLAGKLSGTYDLEKVPSADNTLRYAGTSKAYVEYELFAEDSTITWSGTTGCRPPGDMVGGWTTAYDPPAEGTAVLKALNVTSAKWQLSTVTCGDLGGPGGHSRTITGSAKLPKDTKADISALSDRLPSDATLVVSQPDLVAYRLGDMSWAATLSGRHVKVTQTSDCSVN